MALYYTLIPALPALAPFAKLKELPISTLQLEQRLKMLEPAEHAQLAAIVALCAPETGTEQPDADTVAAWQRQVALIESAPLRQLVAGILFERTVLAALRYRQAGQSDPRSFQGFGEALWVIREHWQEPLMGLEKRCPWLNTAYQQLKTEDSRALEQSWLGTLWDRLRRFEQEQGFCFATVVAYRLRWMIAEYRLRWQHEGAVNRFASLLDSVLQPTTDQLQTLGIAPASAGE